MIVETDSINHADFVDLCNCVPESSVDLILCDLPYGTTQCAWDAIIPFDVVWSGFKRVLRDGGQVVLTACQPFTSHLILSNLDWFRYTWVWEKPQATRFLDAKRRPLNKHEDIVVFSPKRALYNPQMSKGSPYNVRSSAGSSSVYGAYDRIGTVNGGERYPTTVLRMGDSSRPVTRSQRPDKLPRHPTQKPVDLFAYLINTYTNEGMLVFDPCAGSGTTALACIKTNRHYICGDNDANYIELAKRRVELADPYTPTDYGNGETQLSLFGSDGI